MGLLLGRSLYVADHELPAELRAHSLREGDAAACGQQLVFFCPRCHRRLCPLWMVAIGVWRLPGSRLEKLWLGGGTVVRCHLCGVGRVGVEELGAVGADSVAARGGGGGKGGPTAPSWSADAAVGGGIADSGGARAWEGADGEDIPLALQRRVSLRVAPKQVFRPFCVCVCGAYESVVTRAAALLEAEEVISHRRVRVETRTLKRSELASSLEGVLPTLPLELLVVAHRISGQRNPITDAHGLYSSLIDLAWARADVVLVCLFDLPTNTYFSRMLDEQPTLLGLFSSGRVLPLFAQDEGSASPEAEGPPRSYGDPGAQRRAMRFEQSVAGGWLLRCLDGRVPRVEAPGELAKAAGGAAGASAREAVTGVGSARCTDSVTESMLNVVVDAFAQRPLVRD